MNLAPSDAEMFFLKLFEVATNTKIRDLIKTIAAKLGLISDDGFSIFIKTPDKVCAKTFGINYLPSQNFKSCLTF